MSITSSPRRRGAAALVAAGSLAVAVCGAGAFAPAQADGPPQRATVLKARLSASGDPDGAGRATLRLDRGRGRVCAAVSWQEIDAPDAAHIHRHSDGSIVVDLTSSVTGGAACVTGVSKALITRIARHPRRYYVNVHNEDYPAGAIQGTLHR
jgi:CHRD domain